MLVVVAAAALIVLRSSSPDDDPTLTPPATEQVTEPSLATELAVPGGAATRSDGLPSIQVAETDEPLDPATIYRASSDGIVGYVVDERGVPVPGVRLATFWVRTSVVDGRSQQELRGGGAGTTYEKGTFRRNFEGAGPIWLRIDQEPGWVSEPVEATLGGPAVKILARKREVVRIRVVDSQGKPVSGANVQAMPVVPRPPWTLDRLHAVDWSAAVVATDALAFFTTTDAEGRARLTLPDRRLNVALDVTPPPYRDDVLSFHAGPWDAPNDSTIKLLAGAQIRGRVVDPGGKPVTLGRVNFTASGQPTNAAPISRDGTFALPVLPPGLVRLEAFNPRLLRAPESSAVDVQAGATGVVLVLDTGSDLIVRVTNRSEGALGEAILTVQGDVDGNRGASAASIGPDATAVLRGLRDNESYVLWIPPDRFGDSSAIARSVYRTGITLRDSPLLVEEVEGRSLEVDAVLKGSGRRVTLGSIESRGVRMTTFPFRTHRDPIDRSERHWTLNFDALPAGTWTVRVDGIDESDGNVTELSGEGVGVAGGSVRIVLEPTKPVTK